MNDKVDKNNVNVIGLSWDLARLGSNERGHSYLVCGNLAKTLINDKDKYVKLQYLDVEYEQKRALQLSGPN